MSSNNGIANSGYNDISELPEDPRIVYNQAEGVVAITHIPAIESIEGLIRECEYIVPEGVPFGIVSANDFPSDREFRNAWYADESILTAGVGTAQGADAESAKVGFENLFEEKEREGLGYANTDPN